ncbi:DUF1553 domain-containing protein [Agriterribacter sp.]|uniref:DUF1553 domain-containing protein n=1 Tax=Agriterribacter sp. TaxID=2821509 RepID=UPI002BB807A8|nr:DUF1553 domain-containing protein [Agriterribacter sp.]HRO44723.1 DUF1553 domain-containing protein [Agriterribacter sp.]HRQ16396.1 DUF1553 domain-containing protein [Agriterribacter sp.]
MKRKIPGKMVVLIALLAIGAFFFINTGAVDKPASIAQFDKSLPDHIDYNLHVKPILSDKCFLCHGPDKNEGQKAGLNLSTREGALAVLTSGKHAIVPGKLAKSELYFRITTPDEEMMMPKKGSNRVLTDYEKAVLIKWIEQGAEYKPHWAFIAPVKSGIPEVKNKQWVKNEIDAFVLQKLESTGLQPSPEADKETLLRRVTLDLTGLPPTLQETDAFMADHSADAYEKVVERLLQSPHYGEKMAVDWLDVSRYADTHGYTVDRYRPMWPWRDWVIKAFNENMPFDRFVTWQLAGDLLPNATREQKIATAFNRNHAQNMEGGIVDEEFRSEYVVDRTSTVGTALMGLTISCARCHDHKFDPISQKEFFSLYSFFNNIDEAGQISWDNAMPVPTMLLTDTKQDSIIAYLTKKENAIAAALDVITQNEKADFEQWKSQAGNAIPFHAKKGLQAHFTFDKLTNGAFINEVNAKDKGITAEPVLVPGRVGNAFKSNGDDVLKLGEVGIFNRFQPFSIGVWVNIPMDLNRGVIFHKGSGDITYNFRGYFLNIKNDKAEILMAHTWPYNNILKVSEAPLPKDKWIQLTLTYDGSGKAKGLKLFMDGSEVAMITEKDNLYKDIMFTNGEQPGLQVGADWRGTGFKNGLVDELVIYDRVLTPAEVNILVQLQAGNPAPQTITDDDLSQYYFSNVSPGWQRKAAELQQARLERNAAMENIPEIMVMEEMKQKRKAYILERGVYDNYGEEVQPDVPAAILPFGKDLPKNRLGLAKWLMDPGNPLTARVVVNRYWQTYFGTGLQKNADNFGNQGGMPSHPELLDWLAIRFRESGWDVRAMQKLIVLSAAYRQSSYTSPELLKKDPENILLARGPSFRLTAEMVRDAALTTSGLLSPAIGGASVKPYQPEGVWAVNSEVYHQDTGSALYRRSLYTFWRRTNPPPSMSTFDAPMRSSCTVQRQKTSTPLQALVLLNDPQFVEAAKVLAEKALANGNAATDRILYCYRALTARMPSAKEKDILENLYAVQYEKFKKQPAKMSGWLTAGDYTIKQGKDLQALAATTVVASTIMNSDAFITKR